MSRFTFEYYTDKDNVSQIEYENNVAKHQLNKELNQLAFEELILKREVIAWKLHESLEEELGTNHNRKMYILEKRSELINALKWLNKSQLDGKNNQSKPAPIINIDYRKRQNDFNKMFPSVIELIEGYIKEG